MRSCSFWDLDGHHAQLTYQDFRSILFWASRQSLPAWIGCCRVGLTEPLTMFMVHMLYALCSPAGLLYTAAIGSSKAACPIAGSYGIYGCRKVSQ